MIKKIIILISCILSLSCASTVEKKDKSIYQETLVEYNEALEKYNKEIEADPGNVKAHYFKAIALLGLERYTEVIESANKGLKIKDNHDELYGIRGYAYVKLGNYHLAKRDFLKAHKLAPRKSVYIQALDLLKDEEK